MSLATTPMPNAMATNPPPSNPRFRFAGFAAVVLLLWFILCRHLSNEWSVNEQYSYGWFVPFFAAFLFWLRWEDRPGKVESENAKGEIPQPTIHNPQSRSLPVSTFAFLLFFLLLPLRLFEVGNPDWRPLGWLHAAIVVALTLLIVWRVGGSPWLRHFAFPICFILIAVPWVSPIETPIVQGLMRIVATIASEVANLFGIPAQLEGSVIRISSGVVGVNEACSGVRSLQTSLMIGLLFGELKRLSVSRRIALVAAASGVAFLANCARAFFLVWIAASRGVAAVEQWHDLAGYVILGAVFLGTMGIAALLGNQAESEKAKGNLGHSAFRLPPSAVLLPLLWLVAVEGAVELWYRSHERNLVATRTWDVTWPEGASGFRNLEISEDVRSTLRFDRGREASWRGTSRPNESTAPSFATVFMFFFRWEPGTSSILRARSHRPDICMPNTGWRLAEDRGVRSYAANESLSLPFRHFTFARPETEKREVSAHAFFCQREDRVPHDQAQRFNLTAGATSDWSRSDRVRVVLEGLRNQGQQVMQVVLIAPQMIDAAAAEAEFAKLVPELVKQNTH